MFYNKMLILCWYVLPKKPGRLQVVIWWWTSNMWDLKKKYCKTVTVVYDTVVVVEMNDGSAIETLIWNLFDSYIYWVLTLLYIYCT